MRGLTANENQLIKAMRRGDLCTILRLFEDRMGADVVRVALGDKLVDFARSQKGVRPDVPRPA